jgi:hypothetical protein
MRVLPVAQVLGDLRCPACEAEALREAGDDAGGVGCGACGRRYPVRHGVVDFVLPERLSENTRREHRTNAVDLESARAMRRRVRKGERNPVLMAQARRSVRAVERVLGAHDPRGTLVSVGSGTGFELRLLLESRPFARVYSSDLAWSATALVPEVTRELPGDLGLFAADFDHLPTRRRPAQVGLSFLALHHADDPHASLERLLERSFDRLVLVEPTTNWLVELLARLGLARRVEYSGVRPEWLSLRRVRGIADRLGYATTVETWWEVPRDRLPRRIRKSRHGWRPVLAAVEALSALLRPLGFGSMAAIALERRASSA